MEVRGATLGLDKMTGDSGIPNPRPEVPLPDDLPLNPLDPLLENLCEPNLPVELPNPFNLLPPEEATL